MMLTVDSMDDSLIERKQKEIKMLNERIAQLEKDRDSLVDNNCELLKKNMSLEDRCQELEDKLFVYEHDFFMIEEVSDGFNIKYWDDNSNNYQMFACFYFNNVEKDLKEFCEEFVWELQDTYVVES